MAKKKKFSKGKSREDLLVLRMLGKAGESAQTAPDPIWPSDLKGPSSKTPTDPNFQRPPAKYSESVASAQASDEFVVEPASLAQSNETYILCPTGDVLVKLAHEGSEVRYLVAGQILRLISPVWDKCLDPTSPFKIEIEDGTDTMVLRLEDDDPDCLLNVFRCTHFQFSDVPSTIKWEDLKSIAQICDKYDCAKVLKPWQAGWLTPWESLALDPGYEDWLFISKVFEETSKAEELITRLIDESSSLSECGTYFKRGTVDVPTDLIPQSILDRIMTERDLDVQTRIKKARCFLEDLMEGKGVLATNCPDETCTSLAYGSLLRSVKKSGLWPLLNRNEDWHGSLKDLKVKLNNVTYDAPQDSAIMSWFKVSNSNSYCRYGCGYNCNQGDSITHAHICPRYSNRATILKGFRD